MSVLTTETKAEILLPLVVLALLALMVDLLVAELPMGAGVVKVEAVAAVAAVAAVMVVAVRLPVAQAVMHQGAGIAVLAAASLLGGIFLQGLRRRSGSQALKRLYPAHPLVPVGVKLTPTG